jgi:hypothetical protein
MSCSQRAVGMMSMSRQILAHAIGPLVVEIALRRRGILQAGQIRLLAILADEIRKDARERRDHALRDRLASTAVADEQRVDVDDALVRRRQRAHGIIVARLDDARARRGKAVGKRLGTGNVDDLQLAVAHGLHEERCIRLDDHRAQIQVTALEHRQLLVQRLRRHLDIQLGQLRHDLPREILGAAADGTDADAEAPQVRHRPDAIGTASEYDKRLGTRQARDELERMGLGPREPVLRQCELDLARRLGSRQARDILDRAGARHVAYAAVPTLCFGGCFGDDRVVVALFAA